MKAKISTINNENIFFILLGALFSALIFLALIVLDGGGFISGDVLLFSFKAFIVSLTPVFLSKTHLLKPDRVRSTYLPLCSRKDLTHRNDPLLM